MSLEQKSYFVNLAFKSILSICALLASIIFYSMRDSVEEIRQDVVVIKLNIQRIDDHGQYNDKRLDKQEDAINDLNYRKADKK